MIYDFSFINASADKDFFLYILAQSAQEQDLALFFYDDERHTHCIVPDIDIFIESCKTHNAHICLESYAQNHIAYNHRILTFADAMSHNMPLSLHFRFLQLVNIKPSKTFYERVQNAQESMPLSELLALAITLNDTDSMKKDSVKLPILRDSKSLLEHFASPKTYYYTPQQTRQILSFDSESFAMINPHNLAHKDLYEPPRTYFTSIITALKNGESVAFDTSYGTKILSLQAMMNTYITMPCDIASLKTYFRIYQAQIDALASFEKPHTYLPPKDVFADTFPLNVYGLALVGLPYDMPLAIIAALLLRENIDYFFLSHPRSYAQEKPVFAFHHSKPPKTQILNIAQNGLYVDTAIKQNSTLQTLIGAHLPDDTKHSLVIYLSTHHPSAFLIQNTTSKVLLDISFDNNPHIFLESIARDYENGDTLLQSFGSLFPNLLASNRATQVYQSTSQTHNLIDILDVAASILGITANDKSDKNAIFTYAYRFVRERGPRIDYKLMREHNHLKLDYARIIRSCISFKCAGVEDAILCFGLIDSLSEFIATLVRDSLTNLAIDKVLVLGNMLENTIFLNKLLEYLPKNIHLILPKDGFIDY